MLYLYIYIFAFYLVALGYSSSEALKALNGIEITDDTDVEDILKAALKNMAFM